MFGEIVSLVEASFFPIDVELALAYTVTDPVEAHVNCLGSFLFDGVIGDAGGSAVVSLDGSRWLGVTEFFKGGPDGASFLAVVEESG